jgi:hypothetical protein
MAGKAKKIKTAKTATSNKKPNNICKYCNKEIKVVQAKTSKLKPNGQWGLNTSFVRVCCNSL